MQLLWQKHAIPRTQGRVQKAQKSVLFERLVWALELHCPWLAEN